MHEAESPIGALALGHGAGGGVGARDLTAVRDVALAEGFTVVLVEQPYRVAGRRSPAPARQLDLAWVAVIGALRESELSAATGRWSWAAGSSGARVACRTGR